MTHGPDAEEGRRNGDEVHRFVIRVYYEDTDAGGIVYHANHLRFAERARTEMLRSLGLEHGGLREEHGVAFAVRRCGVDYRAPARLDDRLVVSTRLLRLGGASMDLEQRIWCDDRLLVDIMIELVLLDRCHRVARLPAALEQVLKPLRRVGGSGIGTAARLRRGGGRGFPIG